MNFRIEQVGDMEVLTLEGELTVETAGELKEVLIKALSGKNHVVVNIQGATEFDLSCLQLLCSAHRTSIGSDKCIELARDWPEAFHRLVKEAGYSRHRGCHPDRDKSCLWVRKEEEGDEQDHYDGR